MKLIYIVIITILSGYLLSKSNYVSFYKNKEKITINKIEGLKALEEGNLKKAKYIFENLLKNDPENKEYILYLSTININLGNNNLIKKIHKTKNNKNISFEEIKKLIKEKKYKKAIPLLEKLNKIQAESITIKEKLAYCYIKTSQYEKALKIYNILPERTQFNYYKAICLYNLKQYKKALISLKNVKSIDGIYLKGKIYHTIGDLDKALECYLFIDKYTYSIELRKKIAYILLKKEQFSKAIKYFEYLVKKRKKVSDFHYRLAICYEKEKKYDAALKEYQKTVKLKKNHYKAWESIGNIYYLKKNWDVAIKALKTALKHNPNLFSAYIKLGFAYSELNQKQTALYYYKKALSIKNIENSKKNKLTAYIKALENNK